MSQRTLIIGLDSVNLFVSGGGNYKFVGGPDGKNDKKNSSLMDFCLEHCKIK